jgi:hypothetical protein
MHRAVALEHVIDMVKNVEDYYPTSWDLLTYAEVVAQYLADGTIPSQEIEELDISDEGGDTVEARGPILVEFT